MIRKSFLLMLNVLFLIAILAGCTKTTEIVPLPPPDTQFPATKTPLQPTDTQAPVTKTLPPPTDTPAMPTQTLKLSPTTSSINELPMIGRVSVASDGTQGNGFSYAPAISADGRYVAFTSNASNLVEGDTNGGTDIFVHDRVTGKTQRVSVASDGTQGANSVDWITSSISADGRYIAFKSEARNLVESDPNGGNCFVHDRLTGETISVSVPSDGTEGGSDYVAPAISADGGYVVFNSSRTGGIFMYDRMTRETTLVPVSTDGTQGNIVGDVTSISADGRYVVFISEADNLVEGDTNGAQDIFVYDRVTGKTTRISVSSDGTQGNIVIAPGPSISADGRYVVFTSWPSNLAEGEPNGVADIFVHDMKTGQTQHVSIGREGVQGCGYSYMSSISADGRYLAFASNATNLVEADTNRVTNIFVRDLWATK